MRALFVVLVMAYFAGLAFAIGQSEKKQSTTPVLLTEEELAIRQKAKKRLYPGGADEESLRVQDQLPQAQRKMGPATEAPEEHAD